jgi:hypothetical protein
MVPYSMYCTVHLYYWLTLKSKAKLRPLKKVLMMVMLLEVMDALEKSQKATITFVMSVRLPVRLSVCTEHLGSHWTDFHEISYFNMFSKSVQKIQVSSKSDKNNGHFTRRPMHAYGNISLNSSQNQECFRQNLYRTSKYTFHFQYFYFHVYKIMRKNIVQPDRQHTTK